MVRAKLGGEGQVQVFSNSYRLHKNQEYRLLAS